ncbi:hypothetical protein [Arvimicrobium flavum]|uniref:hypothetical protein n=1 Tax=Arvimicrobium flavum TaxID=3393320 RepID=UPI00237BB7B9|nr:hypothetical protein [Mesorhizobium shangrilense]
MEPKAHIVRVAPGPPTCRARQMPLQILAAQLVVATYPPPQANEVHPGIVPAVLRLTVRVNAVAKRQMYAERIDDQRIGDFGQGKNVVHARPIPPANPAAQNTQPWRAHPPPMTQDRHADQAVMIKSDLDIIGTPDALVLDESK